MESLQPSTLHPQPSTTLQRNHTTSGTSIVIAIIISVTLPLAPVTAVRGATIEFDASKKSPAVIPFDPDASFEAANGYVSGRIFREATGPVVGGTNINTLL